MCNIKLDSTAQNPDAGAEARFALPFENLNIQLINLEKRDGKNLSLTTKGLQNVEKTGILFLYSILKLCVHIKVSENEN